jgi:hypothetical protein
LIDNIHERISTQQKTTTETHAKLENTSTHTEENTEILRQENIRSLTNSLNTLLPADNSKPYKPLLDKLQTIDPNNP